MKETHRNNFYQEYGDCSDCVKSIYYAGCGDVRLLCTCEATFIDGFSSEAYAIRVTSECGKEGKYFEGREPECAE